jgi:uroporphyrinogen decarboxylase
MADLPAHAINWHDRLTPPTLADARRRRPTGALVGGLAEATTLRRGTVAAIAEEARDAVRQASGVGVIVGPGCVVPLDVADAHLAAVVDAVRRPA